MKKQEEAEGIKVGAGVRRAIIGAVVIGILFSGFAALQGLGEREELEHIRTSRNLQSRHPGHQSLLPGEEEIVSISYGRALKKEDEQKRFTALLDAFNTAESGGRVDPSGRVYLGHLYYLEEKHGAAEVYLPDREEEEYPENLEPLAELFLLFHRGRQAFAEGDYQGAVLELEEGFFPLLDSSAFENSVVRGGRVLYHSVSEASDYLAASFSAIDRPRRALQVYRRLWERRSTEMREDRFISYALLLAEIIEEHPAHETEGDGADNGRSAGQNGKEELRSILEEWSYLRPFRHQSAPVFIELYSSMNQPGCELLAGAEQLEYLRPAFGQEEYTDAVEGLVSSVPEGTAASDVGRLIRLYSLGEWKKMEEALGNLREHREIEEFRMHRYFRYLSAAAAMYAGKETGAFAELEGLFSEFQMYYLNLAGGALAAEPKRDKLAAAALRAGILTAPGTENALEARHLLWSLEGAELEPEVASGLAASKPYPLLDEELTQIAEFIRLGASPVLLDPVVNLLRYSDNIFSLKAELALRQIRGSSRVEDYLTLRYEKAEGRLRERLGSILRK